MHDAAVSAALVRRDPPLLVDHDHDRSWHDLCQPPRDGKPNDARPDHADSPRVHGCQLVRSNGVGPAARSSSILRCDWSQTARKTRWTPERASDASRSYAASRVPTIHRSTRRISGRRSDLTWV